MPGYLVKQQTIRVGALEYEIESLLDRTQYCDPDGLARARGIPEGAWSFFGQLWPAGIVLAQQMAEIASSGQRVLEIGCGLALAGIVAHRRDLDVAVADIHPLGARFLRRNLDLNGLGPLPYHDAGWGESNPGLGRFDLLVGSDVLYEREHPEQVVRFVVAHTEPDAVVVIVDPGRRRSGEFGRRMADCGFDCRESPSTGRMRILRYRRR